MMRSGGAIPSTRFGWSAIGIAIVLANPAVADDVMASAQDCLARSAYFEARDQGREGMEAVVSVILNRLDHPEFPDDVCAVIEEGGETPPCQFSWWCDGKSDQPTDDGQWELARSVAADALTNAPEDRTRGALFFHAQGIDVGWEDREPTVTIGGNVFYR